MNEMRDILLNDYSDALTQCGMDQCTNFEHVMETALQHCIVKPLSPGLYKLLEMHFDCSKSSANLQKGMEASHLKSTEQMGIRVCGLQLEPSDDNPLFGSETLGCS